MASSKRSFVRVVNASRKSITEFIPRSGIQNLDYGEATAYLDATGVLGDPSPLSTTYTTMITKDYSDAVFLADVRTMPRSGTAKVRVLDVTTDMTENVYETISTLGHVSIKAPGSGATIVTELRADTIVTILLMPEIEPVVLIDDDFGPYHHQSDFKPEPYMGTWHQIADIPQYFEQTPDGPCARSRAQYTLMNVDGVDKVKVTNTCYDASGRELRTVMGQAEVADMRYPAGLIVSFDQPGGLAARDSLGRQTNAGIPIMPRPKHPNYIIHETDYITYTLIGSSDRSNLYILSREPTMSASLYDRLVASASKLGYDVAKLVKN